MRHRLLRHPRHSGFDINVTPLLDVVFIMLIFFIVTANFVQETGVEVQRPQAQTATVQAASLLVGIDQNNHIWMNRRQIDLANVRIYIERFRSETPQGNVVIQADQDSSHGVLVGVIDQIRLAGVTRIVISATPE